jgi:D-glycero-D-manno-heptose 1,7-bisphosphate phosphatase
MKKAVFLDRDGVINHDPGDYTTSLQEFVILPDVIDVLKKWSEAGYYIVVVTNQGGIAKERYTLEEFQEIDDYMREKFLEAGVNYLETYFCPHHDALGRCLCRKPNPGMVEKALARHSIDPEKSVMIGDKWRDLEAADKAGVKGIKVEVNQSLKTVDLSAAFK